MLYRVHKVYALDFSSSSSFSFLLSSFLFNDFFFLLCFITLEYYLFTLLYFTFDSALSCYYYPIFVLFFLFFSFRFLLLAHTEYILPLTFNPSSGRKQDSGCRTKQWGRAKRAEKHRSILLHTYIAFIGWDRLGLVWIFQMFGSFRYRLLSFFWYSHTKVFVFVI